MCGKANQVARLHTPFPLSGATESGGFIVLNTTSDNHQ